MLAKSFDGFSLKDVDVVPGRIATFHLINRQHRMPRNVFEVRAWSLGSAAWEFGASGRLVIPFDRAGRCNLLVAVDEQMMFEGSRGQRQMLGYGILWACEPGWMTQNCGSLGTEVIIDLKVEVRPS